MILDIVTYENTSFGSAKQLLCRCDTCGVESMARKQKIYNRGGYFDCQKCAAAKTGQARLGFKHSNATKDRLSAIATGKKRPPLSAESMAAASRKYYKTACSQCGAEKLRRQDHVKKSWNGLCRKCSTAKVAARDEMKAIQRQNGLKYVAKYGPPPWQNISPEKVRRGPANNKWRGGITPAMQKIRLSPEMKVWRKAVFARDEHTCRVCKKRGGDKHADHIQPFALFPELRFDVSNGRTLCVPCHRTHGALVSNGVLTRASTG